MYLIGIGDLRALAGAIRIGLPDGDVAGDDTISAGFDVIVIDLRVGGITEVGLVYKGKVGHVKEVFDRSRRAGLIGVWSAEHFAKGGIIPLREGRDIVRGLTEGYPDETILFLSMIDQGMSFFRGCLLGVSGIACAVSFSVVGPTVIRTDDVFSMVDPKVKSKKTL